MAGLWRTGNASVPPQSRRREDRLVVEGRRRIGAEVGEFAQADLADCPEE
jgi:hypothetical protein